MKNFKDRIKCTKDCLIVFWLSIFAMILISAIDGNSPPPQLIPQDSMVYDQSVQDTIRKDTTKKDPETKKLNGKEKKQKEYEEYQKRSVQIDEDMKRMEQQSILMDSLLRADTTKIVK